MPRHRRLTADFSWGALNALWDDSDFKPTLPMSLRQQMYLTCGHSSQAHHLI
ncbi:hypothetical protein PSTT_15354 [Puccinia striiformis]|uniref:Uncharacterized protein n=1 Tax=Puccinia striiformis TaxID=27350 RepID=A0A2S4UI14_9BASI|nr:hypothetical protein PSTT_15354 [Puccinia striiformis]